MVVDAPEVLDRLKAVHDLDATLVRLAGIPALLLRPLAVVPEAVPILSANERAWHTGVVRRRRRWFEGWGEGEQRPESRVGRGTSVGARQIKLASGAISRRVGRRSSGSRFAPPRGVTGFADAKCVFDPLERKANVIDSTICIVISRFHERGRRRVLQLDQRSTAVLWWRNVHQTSFNQSSWREYNTPTTRGRAKADFFPSRMAPKKAARWTANTRGTPTTTPTVDALLIYRVLGRKV